MNLKTVYLRPENALSNLLKEGAERDGLNVLVAEDKISDLDIDGLIILTNNLDITREDDELIAHFDKQHVPARKVDLNGTLQVAANGLDLWMKNNKCQRVAILGEENVTKNENLDRFLDRIRSLNVMA